MQGSKLNETLCLKGLQIVGGEPLEVVVRPGGSEAAGGHACIRVQGFLRLGKWGEGKGSFRASREDASCVSSGSSMLGLTVN